MASTLPSPLDLALTDFVVLRSSDGSCLSTDATGNLVAATFNYGTNSANTSFCGSTTLPNLNSNSSVTASQESVFTLWALPSTSPRRYLITSSAGNLHECLVLVGSTVRRSGTVYDFCGQSSYSSLLSSLASWQMNAALVDSQSPLPIYNFDGTCLSIDSSSRRLTRTFATCETFSLLRIYPSFNGFNPEGCLIESHQSPNYARSLHIAADSSAVTLESGSTFGTPLWNITVEQTNSTGTYYTISQMGFWTQRCVSATTTGATTLAGALFGTACGYSPRSALWNSSAMWELINIPTTQLFTIRTRLANGSFVCLQSPSTTANNPAVRWASTPRHCGFSNYTALLVDASVVWRVRNPPQATIPPTVPSPSPSPTPKSNSGGGLSISVIATIVSAVVASAVCIGIVAYTIIRRQRIRNHALARAQVNMANSGAPSAVGSFVPGPMYNQHGQPVANVWYPFPAKIQAPTAPYPQPPVPAPAPFNPAWNAAQGPQSNQVQPVTYNRPVPSPVGHSHSSLAAPPSNPMQSSVNRPVPKPIGHSRAPSHQSSSSRHDGAPPPYPGPGDYSPSRSKN